MWPITLYAVICIFSHQPQPYIPPIPGLSHDKVLHALVFGLLATALIRVIPENKRYFLSVFIIILITSILGIIDEFHQSYIPGRFMEGWDMLADGLGATIAVILYHNWRGYRNVLEYRVR